MRKLSGALFICILLFQTANCNNIVRYISPSNTAMGGTSNSLFLSVTAVNLNPALLEYSDGMIISTGFSRLYDLAELDMISTGIVYDARFMTTALLYSNFGDAEILSENNFALALSKSFASKISLGAKFDYHRVSFAGDYVDLSTMSFAIGSSIRFTDVILHASFADLNRPGLSDNDNKTDIAYRGGLSFIAIENTILNIELSGRFNQETRFHFGQEMLLEDILILRLGLVTNPTMPSGGLGIKYGKFMLDYSISHHNKLGDTHSLGFSVRP